ncbi:MAG: hypothetical protein H0V17_09970, partial [Deltaproteobacteria bacterium]|nr:hypothetical protein [Deltaproteobacteria bacterium]
MNKAIKTVLVSSVIAALFVPRLSFTQPAPTPAPAGGSNTPTPADDKLYSCGKNTTQPVSVSFKPETELKDLITWVMGFTCRNFILDPRIVSTGKKVTIIAPLKMTPQEAYSVFLASLSTMGLTIVPKGNVMRIVESATAKSETVPIYKGGVPANQDQVVRYILRPSHAPVETVRQAIDAIRSPAGNVGVAGNLLIITDYSSQVRDMLSIARSIDVPGNADGIYTIPV